MDDTRVFLVGAGPGDPGLVTRRGIELLERCDCVIYDYLANPLILDWAPSAARRVYVGKVGGQPHLTQEAINEILLDCAQRYGCVVRLKGGDPLVFGRGGEECAVLQAVGIRFEIVPGVTSGIAVPTYAGIPVTHRDWASSVAFITGRLKHSEDDHDWDALARIGTLVCYMGVSKLAHICRSLITAGRAAQTPAAVIQWGTYATQRVVIGELSNLPERSAAANIGSPSIILIGDVVRCRDTMAWWDRRPLFGKTVLVTRSSAQQSELAQQLSALGAQVLTQAAIAIEAPQDYGPLDAAIDRLADYDWIALTSHNAVRFFCERLWQRGFDARALGRCRLAVVGPSTARSLERYGLRADCQPDTFAAQALAERLQAMGTPGRILLPQADNARPLLAEALRAAGWEVDHVIAYRSVPVPSELELDAQPIDAVTFASSVTAERFLVQYGEEAVRGLFARGCTSVVIGPQTAERVRALGMPVGAQADAATIPALVDAVRQALQ